MNEINKQSSLILGAEFITIVKFFTEQAPGLCLTTNNIGLIEDYVSFFEAKLTTLFSSSLTRRENKLECFSVLIVSADSYIWG